MTSARKCLWILAALSAPVLVLLAGCNSYEEPERPLIGYFEMRSHLITIHASSEGPRFTLATKDGEMLEREITAKKFQARRPGLFDTFRSSIAGESNNLDASLFRHELLQLRP